MRSLVVVLGIALVAPALASAQDAMPPPDDASVADDEILRWAAREAQRTRGEAPTRHPPLPPDAYLGHGDETALVVPPADAPIARVFGELGLGALGIAVGGGIGAAVIWGADQAGAAPDGMAVAIGAASVLAGLALSAGVTLGGELGRGRGNFGHAFLGMIVGAAAALPFIVAGLSFSVEGAALSAGGLLPLAGSMIGYEVGHAHGAPRASSPLGIQF